LENETYGNRETADGVEHMQKLPVCVAVMLGQKRMLENGRTQCAVESKKEVLGKTKL
jgi:hypothetical protein